MSNNQRQSIQTEVCIVGCGPAGAFLGYLLARRGIKTVIIERHRELDREFRGEHLHSDAIELLKAVGLFDRIIELGVLPMEAIEFFEGGRRVLTVTRELFDMDHVGVHVPQKHLLTVLTEQAGQTDCFNLLHGVTVERLIHSDKGQVIGLQGKVVGLKGRNVARLPGESVGMQGGASDLPGEAVGMQGEASGLPEEKPGLQEKSPGLKREAEDPPEKKMAGAQARKEGTLIDIYAKVVVGADGRYSSVRRLSGISCETLTHGYDVLWTRLFAPNVWPPVMRTVLDSSEQITLFAAAGAQVQVGWQIAPRSFAELKKGSTGHLIQRLERAAPELEPVLRTKEWQWSDFTCLPVISCRCETWVQDGLILIGDAAHTMSPTGGIGVNVALEDARQLAPILERAIKTGDGSASSLKPFEEQRRLTVERQQRGQQRQEAAIRWMTRRPWRTKLFSWNMKVLDQLPWKRALFEKMYSEPKKDSKACSSD